LRSKCGKWGSKLPAISLGQCHNFVGVNAFDLCVTHFDLVNNYGPPAGSAEENFGKIMKLGFGIYRDELQMIERKNQSCYILGHR
jgi:L-glyceraldehyde 3-phosphate reductase